MELGLEEQEREGEGVAIGTPARSERKGAADGAGWAAIRRGEPVRGRGPHSKHRGPHQTEVLIVLVCVRTSLVVRTSSLPRSPMYLP